LLEKLSACKEMTFDKIRAALGFQNTIRFNLELGHRKKLWGHVTDAAMAGGNGFGKAWHKRPEPEKDAIVQAVLELDDHELVDRAKREWGLSDAAAQRLLKIDLPEGYLHLSRKALENLVPHLECGCLYMTDDDTPSALSEAGYLRPDQREHRTLERLGPPPDVANPVVRQALFEVRKVVNAIVREYGKPTRIHVELARNAKASAEERKRISKQMRDRQAQRDTAAAEVRNNGHKVSGEAIDRYLLWQEQAEHCAYCRKPISPAQLLGGEADVDHILPRSRCLDNSFQNRVVTCTACNRDKGNQTPFEWLAERDPERYEKICQWARGKLPYTKYRRFRQKALDLDQFVARQLNDTRYISRVVLHYVRSLLDKPHNALGLKGQQTAAFRWQWGLHSVLRHDDVDAKNRDDHRHHAVDAIVVALTNQRRLHQLAELDRRGGTEATGELIIDPWDGFRADVERVVNQINVSHRVSRKVAGALHKETLYGKTPEQDVFVHKKPVESLSLAMVGKIRDPVIRQIVEDRLQQHGMTGGRKKPGSTGGGETSRSTISKEVWREPLCMESGVLIKRVRLLERDSTIRRIRDGKSWVEPGSNHHVELVRATDGKRRGELFGTVVTMFESACRVRNSAPIVQRDHGSGYEFVCSLAIGESILLHLGSESYLCQVQKISGSRTLAQRPVDICLRLHTDARRRGDSKPFNRIQTLRKFDFKKVTVDLLGRIRWAND